MVNVSSIWLTKSSLAVHKTYVYFQILVKKNTLFEVELDEDFEKNCRKVFSQFR